MKKAVVKAARKGHKVQTASVKNLTLDSTKNHLKVFAKYTITTDEAL